MGMLCGLGMWGGVYWEVCGERGLICALTRAVLFGAGLWEIFWRLGGFEGWTGLGMFRLAAAGTVQGPRSLGARRGSEGRV